MAKQSYTDARRDYWTECWIPPTMEELKSDGRWERLSKEVQEEYLERERYRLENLDKIAEWQAVFKRAEELAMAERQNASAACGETDIGNGNDR